MNYPIPSLFTQSEVLNQYLPVLSSDNQATRELEQISTQSIFAVEVLKAILNNHELIKLIPIPKRIRTEDGWEFELVIERELYESLDGCNIGLFELLELMALSGQERSEDMFPEFVVLEWSVIRSVDIEIAQHSLLSGGAVDLLHKIVDQVIPQYFLESYTQNIDSEQLKIEALGTLVSKFCEWSGASILKVALSALEDANFKTEAEQVQKILTSVKNYDN